MATRQIRRRLSRVVSLFCFVCTLAWLTILTDVASAEAPQIEGAQIETRLANDLQPHLNQALTATAKPYWLGWSVPLQGKGGDICCFNGRRSKGCSLGDSKGGFSVDLSSETATDELIVLVKAESGGGSRWRIVSRSCPLRGAGERVVWLEGVDVENSAATLTGLLDEPRHHHAVSALAMHATPQVDPALERFAVGGASQEIRHQALFWLGESRGRPGYRALLRLLDSTDLRVVRREIPFALHQSDAPEALDTLIALARKDRQAEVRGQALFWLSQQAGQQAIEALDAAVEEETDVEILRQAVFALSQLPPEEGVLRLMDVARSHRSGEVRKAAFFWLGESGDPRALDFVAEVLEAEGS